MFWSVNWCIEGNNAWFVGGELEMLFCVDLNNFIVKLVSFLPVNDLDMYKKYSYCEMIDNKIFCLPDKGKDIFVYNLNDNSWDKIQIESDEEIRLEIKKIKKINNRLYAFSKGIGKMISISAEDYNDVSYYSVLESVGQPIASAWDEEKYIVLKGNIKYEFDCRYNKITKYSLELDSLPRTNMCCDKDGIWLTGFDNKIINLSYNNEVREFTFLLQYLNENEKVSDLWITSKNSEDPVFIDCISLEKSVWFIPLLSKNIIGILKDKQEMYYNSENAECIQKKEDIRRWMCSGQFSLLGKREERYLYLYSFSLYKVVIFDTWKLEYEIKTLYFDNAIYKDIFTLKNIINEDRDYDLSRFLEII